MSEYQVLLSTVIGATFILLLWIWLAVQIIVSNQKILLKQIEVDEVTVRDMTSEERLDFNKVAGNQVFKYSDGHIK